MSIRTRNIHFTNWAKVIEALADKGVTVADESAARTFLTETSSDANPYYYYVGYIKDTQEIYTHGKFYKCGDSSYDDTELRNLIGTKADLSSLEALVSEVEANEEVTAAALTELHENKADKSEIPDVSAFATTDDLNLKVDTSSLKTVNGESLILNGDDTDIETPDTKVTSVDNHYKTEGVSAQSTTGFATNVIYDAAGHITGLTARSITESDIPGIDASKITSGTISIERLPAGALERMFVVESETAAMSDTVQEGDVVQVTGNNNKMYFCISDTATTFETKFKEFTAGTATSVPWSGVTGKPDLATQEELNVVDAKFANYFLESNFTNANIKSTLGISDWALASSLEWSAINSKPTDINGYGMVEYLTNLNNATLDKFFRSSYQASNRPAYNYAVGFTLGNGSASANYAAQLAIDYYGGVHTRYKASTEWSEWVELAPLSSIPTNNNQLTNGAGYITGITSSMVTDALGVTLSYERGTNSIPLIGSAGTMEIGFIIDFHRGDESENVDYSTRLRCEAAAGNTVLLPQESGTLALTSDIPSLVGYATETFVNTALAGYLPLSGGTINGTLTTKNLIHIDMGLYGNAQLKFSTLNGSETILFVKAGDWRITDDNFSYFYKLLHSGNYSDLLAGGTINGSITATSFVGNLSGNASSATKLATARTIWGQSFDGTGDVSGYITFKKDYAVLAAPVEEAGAAKIFLEVNSGGNVLLGQHTAEAGKNTYIYGKEMDFCYGTAGSTSSTAMHIYSNGDVAMARIYLYPQTQDLNASSGVLRFYSIRDITSGPSIQGVHAQQGYGAKDLVFYQHNTGGYTEYEAMRLTYDGKLAIGGTTADEKLHIYGNVKASGSMYAVDFETTSDNRLKDFTKDVEIDFENLKNIPKKYYYWKDKSMGEDLQLGTSAQELAKIYPECVHYDETNDRYSVNYQKLSIVALAAIDKLHDRISKLESQLYD